MKWSKLPKRTTGRTKRPPCNILILTGSIGSGHVSVARTIAKALHRIPAKGKKIRVEIVDFITALENFATTATKTIYLESLKISPKIYELIFAHSSETKWPVKLLNLLSAPFIQQKFLQLMEEKKPSVLVSTFPIWDILIRKSWDRYGSGKLPFVSIVTDSISIHSVWAMGKPDFIIVPNEDTRVSLRHFGVPSKTIKVFGYPVSRRFVEISLPARFQQKWNLSPKKKTLLLILATGISWQTAKQISRAIQNSKLQDLQLVIISAADEKWRKKLAAMKWPWPTRITGWTNEMHNFIHCADIVLTKAGGATVMECVASKKPVVIISAIPGQEIGNAMLVQKYNLGAVLNREMDNLDSAIEYILSHEALIKRNLLAQHKPKAAENTAKFLAELCKNN